MRKIILLFFLIIWTFSNINESKSSAICELIVNISNLNSDSGNVRVHLYDLSRKDDFPTNSDNVFRFSIGKIAHKSSQVKFEQIQPGFYAVTVHHDANLNIKMDRTIIGLPAEGWGVSNNVKPLMRVPKFDECKFSINSNPTIITIRINN